MKYLAIAALSLALAACGGGGERPATAQAKPAIVKDRPITVIPVNPSYSKRGLEAVMGKDAGALTRLFGQPRLDVVEAYGRKLQFTGKACVLDAYLYPDNKGAEVVTHIDARRADGAEVDRASCVDALGRH